jgi:DNA-binding response OmpR family regulator
MPKNHLHKTALKGGGSGGARVASPEATVLHIDDDPNDTELLRAATRKAGVSFDLCNVQDGEHAMAYLSGTGAYADRKKHRFPDLILLDLKLPRANGIDILKWMRSRAELKQVPVLVLSGSELQDDMRRAYDGGANYYLVKPLGFGALVNLVKSIETEWLQRPHAG